VTEKVANALTSTGTPDILLQTDLDQQTTVTIGPLTLAPVVLFEGSFGTTSAQTITLTNTATNASSLVKYTVIVPPSRPGRPSRAFCVLPYWPYLCTGLSPKSPNLLFTVSGNKFTKVSFSDFLHIKYRTGPTYSREFVPSHLIDYSR
jgi:hypothetical protein